MGIGHILSERGDDNVVRERRRLSLPLLRVVVREDFGNMYL